MRRSSLVVCSTLGLLALAGPAAHAQTKVWTSNADFDSGNAADVAHSIPDELLLVPPPSLSLPVLWADNYFVGTVVKVDTRTGKQLARYDSALLMSNGQPTGARPPREYCNFSSTGNCPGRAVVDLQGNAFFVNRAFGSQGSVTKFAGSLARCVDRNGNGKIDTSSDVNGDGIIDIDDPAEFFGQNDECILWTTPVGKGALLPRSIAVDHNNRVWSATVYDHTVHEFDNATGKELATVPGTGQHPYSMAIGGKYLFLSDVEAGRMQRIDTDALKTAGTVQCPSPNYGIAASPDGTLGYYGRWGGNTTSSLMVADFSKNTCVAVPGGSNTQARGVALDEAGNIWAAQYGTSNTLKKYDANHTFVGEYPLGQGTGMGVAVDIDGNLVTVNAGVNNGKAVDKFAPDGKHLASFTIAGTAANNAKYNFEAYVYSDMTGKQAAKLSTFTHDGAFNGVFDGGALGLPWAKLSWNKEMQGATPAGTSLGGSVRAADSLTALAKAAWVSTQNAALLQGVAGRYVEVRIDFLGDGQGTPVLSDVSIESICPNGVGDGCCLKPADCEDQNLCHKNACPVAGGACVHAAVVGCCNADPDCSDGNLCHKSTCSGKGGTCNHVAIAGCCLADTDCGDSNLCHKSACPVAGGQCTQTPVDGCCNSDSDCDDKNACHKSTCSGPGGTCAHAPIDGCCNADSDCDDKNVCHKSSCSAPGGTCTHAAVMGCCNVDADCGPGSRCQANACVAGPDMTMAGGPDAGVGPSSDGSTGGAPDLGSAGPPKDNGCGCVVGARPSSNGAASGLAMAFALCGALVLRRRRRLGK